MVMTAAQKRAHDKYDKANYTNLAIKIRKTYADEIRLACIDSGVTPSAIMRKAIDQFMESYRQQNQMNTTSASDNN